MVFNISFLNSCSYSETLIQRERQVAYETVKILRKRVIECYRKEGVNHYDNCKKPVADYYDVIIKKDLGQVQPKWENPEKMDGW